MSDTQFDRRLAAVFCADATGYSRHMNTDEVKTHRSTSQYLNTISRLVADQGGRITNTAGDGLIAEFSSVFAAVTLALQAQKEIARSNAQDGNGIKLQFRMGINLGDVIVEGEEIFGDGVNIAKRLEEIAPPGGICVSQSVYQQVKNKLDCGFRCRGTPGLKNIADPVEVWEISPESHSGLMAATYRSAPLSLVPPSRPSVAVMPFVDLSQSQDQAFFSAGIAEDIITNLSKFRDLFVISRDSSFILGSQQVTPKQAGQMLGVRYILKGSVRKADDRIRISANLIEADEGRQIWGETWTERLDDVFALQDAITRQIVVRLENQVEESELARSKHSQLNGQQAYSYVLQARERYKLYTRDGIEEAEALCIEAIRTNPEYAAAWTLRSRINNDRWRYRWCPNPDEVLSDALRFARRALSIDDADARAHSELGIVYMYQKRLTLAVAAFERALALNPNDADIMAEFGDCLSYANRAEEAVQLLREAMRLNPFYPDWYLWHLGDALFALERYEETVEVILRMHNPDEGNRLLAASFALLDREEEASTCARRVLELHPDFSVSHWVGIQPDSDDIVGERFREGLLRAGLPE